MNLNTKRFVVFHNFLERTATYRLRQAAINVFVLHRSLWLDYRVGMAWMYLQNRDLSLKLLYA